MNDIMNDIIRYENGDLGNEEILALFSKLLSTGLIHSLQGTYTRQAIALIEMGLLDATGNIISKEAYDDYH